jgi:hypothetical protein
MEVEMVGVTASNGKDTQLSGPTRLLMWWILWVLILY